jgi:hypothetical protein
VAPHASALEVLEHPAMDQVGKSATMGRQLRHTRTLRLFGYIPSQRHLDSE